jgi:hypothetical protein
MFPEPDTHHTRPRLRLLGLPAAAVEATELKDPQRREAGVEERDDGI